jgi:hypothetical protein
MELFVGNEISRQLNPDGLSGLVLFALLVQDSICSSDWPILLCRLKKHGNP